MSDGISHAIPYGTCHGTLHGTSNEHATGCRIYGSTQGVSGSPWEVLLQVVSVSPVPLADDQLVFVVIVYVYCSSLVFAKSFFVKETLQPPPPPEVRYAVLFYHKDQNLLYPAKAGFDKICSTVLAFDSIGLQHIEHSSDAESFITENLPCRSHTTISCLLVVPTAVVYQHVTTAAGGT